MFSRKLHFSASEERLEYLIQQRLKAGSDKDQIDQQIWDLFGESWAVMFTDLSGFSRSVEKFGIVHFLQIIYESERLFFGIIRDHDGIVVKSEGDSLLVIFRRPEKALLCALDMQQRLKTYNQGLSAEEQILLCVGLGYGSILKIGDFDVFGSQVNAASKLGEDTAKPWEILVTDAIYKNAGHVAEVEFEPIEYIPPGANSAYKVIYSLE